MDRTVIRDLVPIERVWARLDAVERRLHEVTSSSNPDLTTIAQHLLGAGGKRYRPMLALVAAELGPEPGNAPVEAAVAVELIHLGSLYHDDVIDEADARRGTASVNAMYLTPSANEVRVTGLPSRMAATKSSSTRQPPC